jgi:hypothetical protein
MFAKTWVRTTKALREAATVLALILISLGVFFLYDALTRAQTARPQTIVAGSALCFLALALLYFLGRRAEK